MEQYNLPVQYNEEQRKQYEEWGRKRAKIDSPIVVGLIIVIYFLLIKFLFFIQIDVRNASIKDYRFWLFSIVVLVMFYNCNIADLLAGIILVPINYIIDAMCNRPEDPLTIFVRLQNNGAGYIVSRKSINIKSGFLSWDEWELAIDLDTNSIQICNEKYKIGSNSMEFIYKVSDKKQKFEVPKEDLKEITDLKKLKENLKNYKASVEEKEKEKAWEREHEFTCPQ